MDKTTVEKYAHWATTIINAGQPSDVVSIPAGDLAALCERWLLPYVPEWTPEIVGDVMDEDDYSQDMWNRQQDNEEMIT
jgi:hypothetical protein